MTYTVIERLSDESWQLGRRKMPNVGIVEDEFGGRHLLTDHHDLRVSDMQAAKDAGVALLVLHHAPFSEYQWIQFSVYSANTKDRKRGAERVEGPAYKMWRDSNELPTLALVHESRTNAGVHSGFVHLHAHSEHSALDGMSKISEMVEHAVTSDEPALAVTDHGVCAGHVKLANACSKAGIKPIFGIEANFVGDRRRRGDPERAKEPDHPDNSRKVLGEYRHLILWAQNDVGLRNLWAMSTAANHPEAFYGRARMDWEIIQKYSEGVMCSTACLRGPLAEDLLLERDDKAKATLGRLLSIFDERLWIELHTCHVQGQANKPWVNQHVLNKRLIDLAEEYGLPTIAVVDSHYPCIDDYAAHQVWLAAQTNTELTDDTGLFDGEEEYPLYTANEVRHELAYLPSKIVEQSLQQTVEIAEQCSAVIETKIVAPVFSKKGGPKRDFERMVDLCLEAWEKKIGHKPNQDAYEARFEHEVSTLRDKKFCGYFLMVWKYVQWARDHRILVGPGRGSGGGSLVAYLLGIVGIDPVESRLMFERFLNPGRNALPDFDIDFPTSKREVLTQNVRDEYGADNVIRVGTHMRVQNKGVIKKIAAVLKNTTDIDFNDINRIGEIIDRAEAGTAGLGMGWEELWAQLDEELQPYRERYPELFAFCDRLVGRIQGYGKHPAGLVISIGEALIDKLPMRIGEDGVPIAEFDFEDFEFLGLPKFDLLTLRTLDTIQTCMDLVYERHGEYIDPNEWVTEYEDSDVWDMLSSGRTLGVFQVETTAGTRLSREIQPRDLFDQSDIIALDRPGPLRSGLKDQYLRRRFGSEDIEYADPRLSEVLERTYGCIIYQEDVMATCQLLAGYTLQEADDMRRILGKKKVEAIEDERGKFILGSIHNDVSKESATRIFEQMREFAKYSFNRAHSFGYAVLGYWCAWFKHHYPIEFITAILSTIPQKRLPEFVNEARRLGLKVLPPDINESRIGFTIVDDHTVRYGLNSVNGVGDIAAKAVIEHQPFSSVADFMERKTGKCNMGVVETLVRIGAFDSLEPNRRALEAWVLAEKDGSNYRCINVNPNVVGPNGLRCDYNWDEEPVELTPTGRRKKPKPPPKKCTKACRRYTPVERTLPTMRPYTDIDIRTIEREVLGLYLSSTPFDDIPPSVYEDWQPVAASDLEDADSGQYPIVATVARIKKWQDRGGNEMAFLTLNAIDGDIECTMFKKAWKKYKAELAVDKLIFGIVTRQEDGRFVLITCAPTG